MSTETHPDTPAWVTDPVRIAKVKARFRAWNAAKLAIFPELLNALHLAASADMRQESMSDEEAARVHKVLKKAKAIKW